MTIRNPDTARNPKGGFVLPFALAVLAVAAITSVTLISYFNGFSRNARLSCAQTRCRLAAQSVIEETKSDIQKRFTADAPGKMRSDPMMVSLFRDWFSDLGNMMPPNDEERIEPFANGGLVTGGKTIRSPVSHEGCTVYIGVLPSDIPSNTLEAVVSLIATAEIVLPNRQRASTTVLESVRFHAGQNEVFNYAYFANNYGWFQGNTSGDDFARVNGDMRANGNVFLRGATINGFAFAAQNPTLGAKVDGVPVGVLGDVSVTSSHVMGDEQYRSFRTNRMRPTTPLTAGGDPWFSGFDAPLGHTLLDLIKPSHAHATDGTLAATSGSPLISEGGEEVLMPMITDLNGYIAYAKSRNGTLKCPAYSYTDSAGNNHSIAAKTIQASYSGVGPSEIEHAADHGALVLVGTKTNPIEINGPVVISNDVLVTGYIKGQGTIYCGRNVHVLGDIKYVDPPDFSNPASSIDTLKKKDLVCFIAKGNVALGDYNNSSHWNYQVFNSVNTTEEKYTYQWDIDPSDAAIGYGDFQGDYTAVESSGEKKKIRVDNSGRTPVLKTQQDRKYYETCCDDALLTAFTGNNAIVQIDGVLYNNHCILGHTGRTGIDSNYNGALVCRNEGILSSANVQNFNWDTRLRPGSPAYVENLALPLGLQTPHTLAWQQVPDFFNPVYPVKDNEH